MRQDWARIAARLCYDVRWMTGFCDRLRAFIARGGRDGDWEETIESAQGFGLRTTTILPRSM